jgi:hypothetical protein
MAVITPVIKPAFKFYNMKQTTFILIFTGILLFLGACKKDNYAPPNGSIHGALVDGETGDSLELSGTGNNSTVRMIVDDPAKYPAPSNFDLAVKQNGTYSNSHIFAETYKVIPVAQSGPWQYLSGDTSTVTVGHGQDAKIDFKVVPFFRISKPMVADSTVTFTITKSSTTSIANDLSGNGNLLILINNSPSVNESICSNQAGQYYQNQFRFTVTNDILGQPFTPHAVDPSTGDPLPYTFNFSAMHLPHGAYYLRVAAIGNGSSGKYNYSITVEVNL